MAWLVSDDYDLSGLGAFGESSIEVSSLVVNLSDSQDGLGLSSLQSSLTTVATLALDNNNLLLGSSANLDDILLFLDLGDDFDSSFNSNLFELNLV